MRLIKLAAIVITAMAVASPSWASFITNRTGWNNLSREGKALYVSGVLDGFGFLWDDSGVQEAVLKGQERCMADLKLSNVDVAKIVDDSYEADVANWSKPPLQIVIAQVGRMCRRQVNEERVARGLPAWPDPAQ